ncbi:GspH/FimT family pseudopilin [Fretibacter rubidus]|uniref:GspH/FimT family pseudopilin n=1 Tax=Fretibacter rubidus TaxID=570162 RepID=UPI00352ACD95
MWRAVGISKSSGFTLIELLTVLVIIGLMSSAVVMTLPRDKPAVIAAATTLHTELNMAAQTSLLSGQVTALSLSKDGYHFQTASGDDWTATAAKPWPSNIRIEFARAEQSIDLPQQALPLVLFDPTGGGTAFRLTLSDMDNDMVLTGSGDGTVSLVSGS